MSLKKLLKRMHVNLMSWLNSPVNITAVVIIIEKDGKLLLVEEGSHIIPEKHGKLNLPMGRVKKGENPYKRALREGRKKISHFLKIDKRIRPHRRKISYDVSIGKINMTVYAFGASIYRGELVAHSGQWFSRYEIEQLKEQGRLFDPFILTVIGDWGENAYFTKDGTKTAEQLAQKLKGEKNQG